MRPRRAAAAALAAGALLIAAAPAVAGPKRAAEAALASLDEQNYRSVSSLTLVSTVRHAWPEVTKLLSMRSRSAIAYEEESPSRSAATFTAGPMRGVRVISYDGVLYVSRRGGPPRRAVGALRRYLLDAVFPDFGTTIVGAQVLLPVVRA